jgi:hypothetical protein
METVKRKTHLEIIIARIAIVSKGRFSKELALIP